MLNKEIAAQILEQVEKEFYSEAVYIAMEMYFKRLDLNGYADLFHEYALEERRHAYDMLAFLDDWNMPTTITRSEMKITNTFSSPADVFEKALAHEKFITKSIMDICTQAIKKGDAISRQFLDKYLEEQREEEDKMLTRLMRLRLAGDNTSAILLLDKEQEEYLKNK